jgi:hypothetical protein
MEDTDLIERASAVERVTKAVRPQHEPEVKEAIDAYEEVRARSRETFMLELRFRDGRVRNFDYAHLQESEFVPHDKMILRFGTREVTAEGRNLRAVYTLITEHRRRFIHEGTDEEEAGKPENAAHIDKIEVRIAVEV